MFGTGNLFVLWILATPLVNEGAKADQIHCSLSSPSFSPVFATHHAQTSQERYPLHTGSQTKKVHIHVYDFTDGSRIGFFPVAKSGSSQVKAVLGELSIAKSKHRNREGTHRKCALGSLTDLELSPLPCNLQDIDLRNATTFSAVRNPWARMVSVFHMGTHQSADNSTTEFSRFTSNPDGYGLGVDPGHWTPQIDQLITEDGHFVPQFIVCLDALSEGLRLILQRAIADEKVRGLVLEKLERILLRDPAFHEDANLTNATYYRSAYSETTKTQAGEYFSGDVALLGYEF